jgi:DNA polymerase-3 subunit chi
VIVQVDFYQLSRDPVERVVPTLTAKALETGAKVLVVDGEASRREALSQALWAYEAAFLAHGTAGESHEGRQPILLAESCDRSNDASFAILADGKWRDEAIGFSRAILLFEPERVEAARTLWKTLKGSGAALRFFAQSETGRWEVKG